MTAREYRVESALFGVGLLLSLASLVGSVPLLAAAGFFLACALTGRVAIRLRDIR